ncbi:hypothetical protein FRB93_012220 [Tulasnella sp. JGI-2019a]|nr:hypothetical protein FRB93_012220 [Tulasnella sp. JGI-2019a]
MAIQNLSLNPILIELDDPAKRWLESQKHLRDLKLVALETLSNFPKAILPKLERLMTSFLYTKAIPPDAPFTQTFTEALFHSREVIPRFTILAPHCQEIDIIMLSISADSASEAGGIWWT